MVRSFHYFASTLIRLKPELSRLQAFGTDGELQLTRAFSIAFPRAVHLRCVNHIRQNELNVLGIPQTAWKDFLADIFGIQKGSHFEMGVVDAHTGNSFWKRYKNLKNGATILKRAVPSLEHILNFTGGFLCTQS